MCLPIGIYQVLAQVWFMLIELSLLVLVAVKSFLFFGENIGFSGRAHVPLDFGQK